MPVKDIFHDTVKKALIKDGWTITDDPLHLRWGLKDMYIDLGAEKIIAAEKAGRKIGVEVKSFIGKSEMRDLENAVGQYTVYYDVLKKIRPTTELYIAVTDEIYHDLFEEPIGILILENHRVQILVFDPEKEEILQWTA